MQSVCITYTAESSLKYYKAAYTQPTDNPHTAQVGFYRGRVRWICTLHRGTNRGGQKRKLKNDFDDEGRKFPCINKHVGEWLSQTRGSSPVPCKQWRTVTAAVLAAVRSRHDPKITASNNVFLPMSARQEVSVCLSRAISMRQHGRIAFAFRISLLVDCYATLPLCLEIDGKYMKKKNMRNYQTAYGQRLSAIGHACVSRLINHPLPIVLPRY